MTKIEQEVAPEIVENIADEFAEWLDSQGFEIVWKRHQERPDPDEPDWDYATLARDFVRSKQGD